jgi:hypothetical protein
MILELSCRALPTHVVLLGRREPAVVVADKRRLISPPARTGRRPLCVSLDCLAPAIVSWSGLVNRPVEPLTNESSSCSITARVDH